MSDKELKTSAEWLRDEKGVTIYDPDGWDRSNFDYSFNVEKIIKQEFIKRLIRSTIICKQESEKV